MSPSEHHGLEVARSFIIGGFLLFLCLVILFTVDLRFRGNAIEVGTTVNIVNSTPFNCTLSVGAGFNLVSLPCITTATPIDNVTAGVPVRAVYQYVPGDQDLWRVYNPNLPWYVVSDLQYMTRRAGYVFLADAPATKTIDGVLVASTDIPLVPGWNLIGYPSDNISNVTTALAAINDSFTQIATYDAGNATFLVYDNPGGGSLVVMVPGQGYWVNATKAGSWVVTP